MAVTSVPALASEQYVPIGTFSVNHASAEVGHEWTSVTPESCSCTIMEPLKALLAAAWLQASVRLYPDEGTLSIVRVYSLPFDVNRGHIPRDDNKLVIRHHKLLASLDISQEAWKCFALPDATRHGLRIHSDEEDSLFYLFNTIPSPDIRDLKTEDDISQDAIDSLLEPHGLPDLKTELYPFQRRSAAAAIKREVEPQRYDDPRLQKVIGPLGHVFYYDCQTGHLLKHAQTYEEPTGGVLAENQGLGKTLIALSIIRSTRGHFPRIPPQHSLDLHPVRTEVGSLMQMAAAAVVKARLPWRSTFQTMSDTGQNHDACFSMLEDNPGEYYVSPQPRFRGRHSPNPIAKRVRLCSATIIVVPQNLVSQWQREIMLHFSEGAFKTLVLSADDEFCVPSAARLMTYDIILFSRKRFEQELRTSGGECTCLSQCHCSGYHSPLLDVHFLRVIMDEGHEFALGRNNNTGAALSR